MLQNLLHIRIPYWRSKVLVIDIAKEDQNTPRVEYADLPKEYANSEYPRPVYKPSCI